MSRQARPLELTAALDPRGGGADHLRFDLLDWAALAPGMADREAWVAWARTADAPLPGHYQAAVPTEAIPTGLRRRLDRMGRLALQALFAIGPGDSEILVFASRFGELARSIDLMRQIGGGELPSPAGFALSVHNALAGQASIFLKNRVAHSAVAAGPDTLPMGILEAVLAVADHPGREAILVCYDVPPPSIFLAAGAEQQQVAVALRLRATVSEVAGKSSEVTDGGDPIPCRALLRLLANEECSTVSWRGRHGTWTLRHAA